MAVEFLRVDRKTKKIEQYPDNIEFICHSRPDISGGIQRIILDPRLKHSGMTIFLRDLSAISMLLG